MISSCWRRICSSCWRMTSDSQDHKKTEKMRLILNPNPTFFWPWRQGRVASGEAAGNRRTLVHFSPTVRLLTSSPLMGEERGEGDRSLQRPLTLALSREGRGNSRSTHRSKSGIFCRINVKNSKFLILNFELPIAHRRDKGVERMELQIGVGPLLRADGGGHLGRVVMAGE